MRPGMGLGAYHATGAVNALLFLLSVAGLAVQISVLFRRRADPSFRSNTTALLSLNYFSVSFLAYFAFMAYGASFDPINPYLVWPRLLGCGLVLVILAKIARDRRTGASLGIATVAALMLAAGLAQLWSGRVARIETGDASRLLAVVATALIVQSLLHQILLVRRAGHRGAVSWSLHLFTLAKDLSTVLFGTAMGLAAGWPLLLMGGASAALKLVLLWHLRSAPAQVAS